MIQAAQMLDSLGIAGLRAARTATLSGGEAQRIAVARALVKRSRVVIADEPTASLDARNAGQVTELLLTRIRETGAALIMATHDPTVAGQCDRLLSLSQVEAATA